ncbi:MAG: SGNH/GDSL hydrolase family protein [Planctomycetota bacterium]
MAVISARAWRWLRRLALVLGAVVGTCLLVEASVLLIFGEQAKFPRRVVGTSYGVRTNVPNSHYRHKSAEVNVTFDINAQGMRARHDYAYAKPPGKQRIVSLGDSFTIGYEVQLDECFSSVLERELNAAGKPVEVLNAGVSGYSNAEECLLLERELLKYQPDLVLVSFYTNDLDDNVRTGLFALRGDQLVETAQSYVPMGRLANFLNTNAVFQWLSEYSNAFVLLKERMTMLLKQSMVKKNEGAVAGEQEGVPRSAAILEESKERLAAAIFERIYATTRARGVPLIVQVIPAYYPDQHALVDSFPRAYFDATRPGLFVFAAKSILEPFMGKERLYNSWDLSHGHWTAFSHAQSGKALAHLILSEQLLE